MEQKPKTFAVIGLGVFGYHVVRYLSKYNVNIIAVDKDEQKVAEVKDIPKTIAVVANAIDKKQLEEAGINSEDVDVAIVAIGESVEASVYVSLLLKELGIKKVMSRALNVQHASILAKIGVDRVIFPEEHTAEQLVRSIFSPHILEQLEVSEEYSVAEIIAPKEIYNKSPQEVNFRSKYKLTILAIRRKTTVINDQGETDICDEVIFLPQADEKILPGDILVVAGKNTDIDRFKNL